MYRATTWKVKKARDKKLDMVEMKWMSEVNKLDSIRNKRIRWATQVH